MGPGDMDYSVKTLGLLQCMPGGLPDDVVALAIDRAQYSIQGSDHLRSECMQTDTSPAL